MNSSSERVPCDGSSADGKIECSPVDKGFLGWTAQFRDIKQLGYHDAWCTRRLSRISKIFFFCCRVNRSRKRIGIFAFRAPEKTFQRI
jgi:hypothetical protein